MREIQAIMRQIASSITCHALMNPVRINTFVILRFFFFLLVLVEAGIFDVLAYNDMDVAIPFTWTESDPKLIANTHMVKLHSFDTKIRKVDTLVSYKNDE
ncbi:putative mitotic spindle checkpoint protein Mad2 [Helianthus annuus]|nr:putative HORMA domain superfamily protein [Helianthus annuus]KAJ0498970.1 putative HORMA domain superfamily protein [Helianthus annuus]KAJ0664985.1 putative HORMA domain superfamily protein [Helianthus annuus]KAJ0672408.1 putative HORMA domain superfamily protein [Helianthus annuus]KAJ0859708.1 putative mitotic spindle checkpoint protein Mad2 [Helianthus annuus]